MTYEMRFHHRDSLPQKHLSNPGTLETETKETPVYLPLTALEFHTKAEAEKRHQGQQTSCPLPPSDSRFGESQTYLSADECDHFKFNKHATREKDQQLAANAQRRGKIIANILGLGLPLLLSCFMGHRKDEDHPERPPRIAKSHT